ncbi:hypothetical protein [Spirosoma fluviale]|uniref:Outer membrane protein beta-barrel domain-containing protein n=1 Tax=Spirosoma fluviale TaxID=1597977 RepID=A0A286GBM0_9BACT|nr:hypothetical protein [Spirosoma fluviale]SOD92923.1 hypothetical protein SAMN06269250_4262 [Spirosoma fluviale]
MKRLLTSLLVFGLTLTSLYAQEIPTAKASRFGFGVFAGLSYTYPRITTRFPDHFNPHSDLITGVDLRYQLTRLGSLHVQPSWTQVRNVKPASYWSLPIFSLSTVKIPVVYRHYVLPSGKLLFLEAGVSYNHIASSTYKEQQIVYCIVAPCPVFYSGNLAPVTRSAVSALAGIGVTIDIQKVSIPVTLRYERYASDFLFPTAFETGSTPVKFEGFAITTGVNF